MVNEQELRYAISMAWSKDHTVNMSERVMKLICDAVEENSDKIFQYEFPGEILKTLSGTTISTVSDSYDYLQGFHDGVMAIRGERNG